MRLFREKDKSVLHGLMLQLRDALISCAESLQYEASTLPATQMGQTVLPEKFTRKQQKQSRLDPGVELDGSHRRLLETTAQELPGHHVLEHRRAHAEKRSPLSLYSQVSLQGCHQSTMPPHRLPQRIFNITPLYEFGMTSADQRAEAPAGPARWCAGDEGDQVEGVAEHAVNIVDYPADAKAFALSYCCDFQALHQLNHDHDCTSTCVNYVQKKSKEAAADALRRGWVAACRFVLIHIVVLPCRTPSSVSAVKTACRSSIRRQHQ